MCRDLWQSLATASCNDCRAYVIRCSCFLRSLLCRCRAVLQQEMLTRSLCLTRSYEREAAHLTPGFSFVMLG